MDHLIKAILILVMAQTPAMSQGQMLEIPATAGAPAFGR